MSVDVIIKGRKGIVFTKRDITPWKGMWHIPGGTVLLGERLTDAIARVAHEETGLTVRVKKLLGIVEYMRTERGVFAHSGSVAYLVAPVKGTLRGSPQGREAGYFSRFPRNGIAEQKQFLRAHKLMRG